MDSGQYRFDERGLFAKNSYPVCVRIPGFRCKLLQEHHITKRIAHGLNTTVIGEGAKLRGSKWGSKLEKARSPEGEENNGLREMNHCLRNQRSGVSRRKASGQAPRPRRAIPFRINPRKQGIEEVTADAKTSIHTVNFPGKRSSHAPSITWR